MGKIPLRLTWLCRLHSELSSAGLEKVVKLHALIWLNCNFNPLIHLCSDLNIYCSWHRQASELEVIHTDLLKKNYYKLCSYTRKAHLQNSWLSWIKRQEQWWNVSRVTAADANLRLLSDLGHFNLFKIRKRQRFQRLNYLTNVSAFAGRHGFVSQISKTKGTLCSKIFSLLLPQLIFLQCICLLLHSDIKQML